MIKEAYDRLKKQHPELPEFNLLNNEFEIISLEKDDFLIRQIRRKIIERVESVLKLADEFLHPAAETFTNFYECSCFDESEKKELLEIFKNMMTLYRGLIEADVLQEDLNDVRLIKEASLNWPELRKKLVPYITKVKSHWTHLKQKKEIVEYLG